MEDSTPATVTSIPTRLNVFGQIVTDKYDLGDGASYITLQKMTEGRRRQYEAKVSRPMKVNREGEAEIRIDPSAERTALLEVSIVGWDIEVNGEPYAFNDSSLRRFLAEADVDLIDALEKRARDLNPWLVSDVTVEDLDKQIAELTELRDKKLEEEAGK